MEAEKKVTDNTESTPFGKSWKFLYSIVFIELALLILIFYIITKVFE